MVTQTNLAANETGEEVVANIPKLDLAMIAAKLNKIDEHLGRLESLVRKESVETSEVLSVAQASELLQKAPFTIREWCRNGRIECHRAKSGRGPSAEYRIPMASIRKYREQGLLPRSNNFS